MLRTLLRVVLSLPLLLTALMLAVRLGYSVTYPAQPAPALFTHPDCENPCWQGLRPGDTMDDVLSVLYELQVPVDSADLPQNTGPHDTSITVVHEDASGHMQMLEFDFRLGGGDTLTSIHITMTRICLRDLIAIYGLPEAVFMMRNGKFSEVYYHGAALSGDITPGRQQHSLTLRQASVVNSAYSTQYELMTWHNIPEVNLWHKCP